MTDFISFVIITLFLFYMLRRNFKVFEWRTYVNHAIYEASKDKPMSWHQAARELEAEVTYEEMLLKFWKPLESFYDEDFLKAIEEDK